MSLDEAIQAQVAAALERLLPAFAERLAQELQRTHGASNAAPPAPAKDEKPLSLPKAAKYLGVGETTMRGYVAQKLIPYTQPNGTRYKFKVSDLDAFARARARAPNPSSNVIDFDEQSRKNLRKAGIGS